jgi:hypothetical protein
VALTTDPEAFPVFPHQSANFSLLQTQERRVALTPWVVCRYRNDEQITVAMFVNDKHRPQFEAATVRKRQSRQENVAKIHTRHPQGLSYTESSGP